MVAAILALLGGVLGLVRVQTGLTGRRVVEDMRDPKVDVDCPASAGSAV